MKRLILLAMLGLASIMVQPAKAQLSVSVNIGSQPHWGPRGYNHVDYYYLPDIESYYYVPTRKFIYYSGNRWVHTSYLPSRYRGYNLYSGRKYVINSPRPYINHRVYKAKYNIHNSRSNSHYARPHYTVRDRNHHVDHRKDYRRNDHGRRSNHGRR